MNTDAVTSDGRPFQMRGAATGNARSPIVERRVVGTTSAADDDDLVAAASMRDPLHDVACLQGAKELSRADVGRPA
jgi:hypothetical protein